MIENNDFNKKIFDCLDENDLIILYFLALIFKQKEDFLKEKEKQKNLSFKVIDKKFIVEFFSFKIKKQRIKYILESLVKFKIIKKEKIDHTYNYEIDDIGKSIINILLRDTKKKNLTVRIQNLIKNGVEKNA